MGSDPAAAYPPDADETPRRVVRLEPFRLARTPVTVEQYASFAAATGRAAPGGEPRQPVTYVSHADALAFCAWAGARLPSEDEWEAAARGGDERLWPWGDSPPDATRALFDAGIGDPEPVGSRPRGASAHGVLDLAGNVCEWVAEPGIVRGGSFIHAAAEIRCAAREPMQPEACDHYVGFRVAGAAGEARIGFDWVEIPGGAHAVGQDPIAYGGPIRADELPRHLVGLSAFELTRTPVTNGQYAAFVRDTNGGRPAAWAAEPAHELAEHPVTGVDWFDAQRFCRWAGGRLPTEAESGEAARGTDERRYPWGDEEPAGRAVFGAGLKHGATRGGRHVRRRSEPLWSPPHGGQRLGVGLECVPALPVRRRRRSRAWPGWRARAARRLLREQLGVVVALRDAEPQPPAPAPAPHRLQGRPMTAGASPQSERPQIDPVRLRERTLELVQIESPTGDTAAAARLYASWLEEIGMEVELIDDTFPDTPTVVGILKGSGPGPRVVLNGHLDTVPIPHRGPARIEGERIYGRGSADMKGACVCALEAARVLAGEPFSGELAIVAIGLHEAPSGRGQDLTQLLESGRFTADFGLVCELSGPHLTVAHMGQATAEIEISRPGMPMHELEAPPGTPHPLLAAARVIERVRLRSEELAAVRHPWVGAETYFVGELHGGDFYNRHPTSCRIVGTRRWMPGNTLAAVEREYRALLAEVAEETGCEIALELRLVRDPYEIELDHPLVLALQAAYREVTGEELPPEGRKTVADAAILQGVGGIPTVYHGPVGSGAHADVEHMETAELVRATSVFVALLRRLL